MALYLRLCLNHRDYLGTGLHQFCLGQHTSAVRKILKARMDQNQVILGDGGSPNLADAAYLMVPNGLYLPETLTMAQSVHTHLCVVLDTLLGRY